MSSVELVMRGLREIPDAELDTLSRFIRINCDRMESRTVAYLIISLFSEIFPVYTIRELVSASDSMGSLDFSFHLVSGDYFLKVSYSQSIVSDFHHVEIGRFLCESSFPCGISLRLEIDLTTDGYMSISLKGIAEDAAARINDLALRSFERVWPAGTNDPRVEEVNRGLCFSPCFKKNPCKT